MSDYKKYLENAKWFPRPGVNVSDTIREALNHRRDLMGEKLNWFRKQVGNKKPWDFKQLSPMYENFGNFHYGVTGSALGLTPELLLRAAGFAQERAGTSSPEWGRWYDPFDKIVVNRNNRGEVIVSRTSLADQPEDQEMIKLGIAFYNKVRPWFENTKPDSTYDKINIPDWLFETLHSALDSIIPSSKFPFEKPKWQTFFPSNLVFRDGKFHITWTTTSPVDSLKGLLQYKSPIKVTPREFGIVRPYTVKASDRVWNLAPNSGYGDRRQFTQDVLKVNPGLDPRRLQVGQIINLPFKTQLGGGIQSGASAGSSMGINGGIRPSLIDHRSAVKVTPREFGIVRPYTVKVSDRVWNLAPNSGYSDRRQFTQDVLKANPGLDPRRLQVGQIINLPFKTQLGGGIQSSASAGLRTGVSGGIRPVLTDYQGLLSHTVRKGENLTQIAKRYGTSVNALYSANRNIIGSNKNLIHPGQQFVIPRH